MHTTNCSLLYLFFFIFLYFSRPLFLHRRRVGALARRDKRHAEPATLRGQAHRLLLRGGLPAAFLLLWILPLHRGTSAGKRSLCWRISHSAIFLLNVPVCTRFLFVSVLHESTSLTVTLIVTETKTKMKYSLWSTGCYSSACIWRYRDSAPS